MNVKTISARYKAWQRAKGEAWQRAWEFADAVADYAKEKPRGYAQDVSEATGLTASYVRQIKATAVAYHRPSDRNEAASFRVHMQYVIEGRGGEWVPDETTLRDVRVPEAAPTVAQALDVIGGTPDEDIEQAVMTLPPERRRVVQDKARVADAAATAAHPAHRTGAPIGVPKPQADFLTVMAGPINRLQDAVDETLRLWAENEEEAHPDSLESVRDDVAALTARLTVFLSERSVLA